LSYSPAFLHCSFEELTPGAPLLGPNTCLTRLCDHPSKNHQALR